MNSPRGQAKRKRTSHRMSAASRKIFGSPCKFASFLQGKSNFYQKRKTPLLGFFRNYLPSRYPTLSPAPQRGAGGQGAGGEAAASTMAKELRQPRGGGGQVRPPRPGGAPPASATTSTAERAPPRGGGQGQGRDPARRRGGPTPAPRQARARPRPGRRGRPANRPGAY